MTNARCSTCGMKIKPNCDYQQGRCPHRASLVDLILESPYYMRFHNLLKRLRIIK
jgi:hypothetical protein